jgi:hypothetical protein
MVFNGYGNQVLDGFSRLKRELGHWMFEGLILVNQLESKIYPGIAAHKSSIARFFEDGFYGRNSRFSIPVYLIQYVFEKSQYQQEPINYPKKKVTGNYEL